MGEINAFGATSGHYTGAGMNILDGQAFARQADQCGCPPRGTGNINHGGSQPDVTTLAVGEEDGGSCSVPTPPPPADCGHGGAHGTHSAAGFDPYASSGATPYYSPYTNSFLNGTAAGSSPWGADYALDPYGMPVSPWLSTFGYAPGGSYVDAVLNALYSPQARQGVYLNEAAYEANLALGQGGVNALSSDAGSSDDAGETGDASAADNDGGVSNSPQSATDSAETETVVGTSGDDVVTVDENNEISVQSNPAADTDAESIGDGPVTVAQYTPAGEADANNLDADSALQVLKDLNLIDEETAEDIAEGLMAPSNDAQEADDLEEVTGSEADTSTDEVDGTDEIEAFAAGDSNDDDLDADLDEDLDETDGPAPSGDQLS